MGLMILSVVVTACLVVLSFFGGECKAEEPKADKGDKGSKPAEKKVMNPAKLEVLKKLKKLATTESPKKLSPGAKCYSMATPPMRAEYVCPTCNAKTLFANPKGKWGGAPQLIISWELPACRQMLKKIKGLKLTLDESAFCKKCKPNAKKNELALVVDYGDPKANHRVEGVKVNDLVLIKEFLDGKLKHDGGQAGEVPLKKHMGRLEALLGVKLSTLKSKE